MRDIVILGGGLSGLSSGYSLAVAGFPVRVYEHDHVVGGLSKTIVRNGFRFDLGGHRFHTSDTRVSRFVRDLMGSELIEVRRSSKIYLRGKYFDYPLRPLNAVFGLGAATSARIMADYVRGSLFAGSPEREAVSLEDWVVRQFGRTMHEIYFREYSEKVWGIPCDRISATWVDERIKGLSLAQAVKHALNRRSGRNLATLTDRFSYPRLGIGRLSDRLREEIERTGSVLTGAAIVGVNHSACRIESVTVRTAEGLFDVPGSEFVSSIPVTSLVRLLNPLPPAAILRAAADLRFRDLVITAVMVDRERVTDQTWIYLPEKRIPFGRLHEPTNWSPSMAPAGKTLLVIEYFSNRGDDIWNCSDGALAECTTDHLVNLDFLSKREVIDCMVVRVPNAYPLFEVGYRQPVEELLAYLSRFTNLHTAGRSGMFRYYNMDVAMRSGLETADAIMHKAMAPDSSDLDALILAAT